MHAAKLHNAAMSQTATPPSFSAISSKATQAVLVDLTQAYQAQTGVLWRVEAVGGVDAARRVQAGEAFDAVILANDAIDRLIGTGQVLTGSRVDWVRSPVAVAVPQGAPRPDIGSAQALKAAVLAATKVAYSTGPSGVYLEKLFDQWGITAAMQGRCVQAKPGVPVGALLASGEASLGFQQLSELMSLPGINLLGELSPDVAYISVFSTGMGLAASADATRAAAVRAWMAFLASAEVEPIKRRHGMHWV
jgi:molybdate transport system substrate-binding protein